MIISSSLIMYIVSWLLLIILIPRMAKLISYYLPEELSQITTLAVLFHPLSIDAITSPRSIPTGVSILLFIEAMLLFKRNKYHIGLLIFMLTTLFNISFLFFPAYFLFSYYKELKKFKFLILSFYILLFFYLSKHILISSHNPFVFFIYFIQNFIIPLPINIISFSLFPFSYHTTVVALGLILVFTFKYIQKKFPKELWYFLFLPMFGTLFSPWIENYNFWHEVLFASSNFMIMTLALTVMLALSIPRQIFYSFFSLMFIISLIWIFNSFPFSKVIEFSIDNLPVHFHNETILLKRSLARQYLIENKLEEAKNILLPIAKEKPMNLDIQMDLILLEKGL